MAAQNLGRVGMVLQGAWSAASSYVALDVVSYDGNSWAAKRANTNVEPTTENSADWQLISNNEDLVSTVQGYKEDAEDAATAAAASALEAAGTKDYIAPEYADLMFPVLKGQYCWHEDGLYMANADIASSEEWTAAHWDAAVVSNELTTIEGQINDIHEKTGGESENLRDPSTDTQGKYWNQNYEETSDSYYRHTALIDITGYTKIRWENGSSASQNKLCWFVSENNTGVESFSMSASGTKNIPAGAKYVTFTAGKNNTSLAIYGIYSGEIGAAFDAVNTRLDAQESTIKSTTLAIQQTNGKILFDGTWTVGRINTTGGMMSNGDYAATVAGISLPAGTMIMSEPFWEFRLQYNDSNDVRHFVDDRIAYIMPVNGTKIKISVSKINADTSETADIPTWKTKICWLSNVSEYERYKGTYYSLAMFNSWGVVGDSYGEGNHGRSWGSIAAQMVGNKDGFTNYSKSGISTSTYIDSEYGLLKLLADSAKEFYWLQLGINDSARVHDDPTYLGSIADISGSYEDYPDTFYGNYGHIIEAIQAHAPRALMIMATVTFSNALRAMDADATTNIPPVNEAIHEIAEHYGIPCIDILEDQYIRSPWYGVTMGGSGTGNHPTVVAFPAIAQAYMRLFGKCVMGNIAYFRAMSFDD